MALFTYQAYTTNGSLIQGTMDASSMTALKDELSRQSLYPIAIEEIKYQQHQRWYQRLLTKNVSLKDKILFSKQLSVFLRSGIPLLQSIDLLIEQFSNPLRSILSMLKQSIKEGKSLAQSLLVYSSTFNPLYIQLIRAGESSGTLEVMLQRLVDYLERESLLKRKVRSALTMPVVQLVVVVIVVILLLMFVMPGISSSFVAQSKTLPFLTRCLLGVSQVLLSYWYLLIGGLLGIIIGYASWRRTAQGRIVTDRMLLAMPIVGYFLRQNLIVQFCRTLGMLLESGVNLSDALDIVVNITNNQILKNALRTAQDSIIKQGKMAEFLSKTGIFSNVAIYLIKSGEETGQLGAMLLLISKNTEDDLYDYSDRLASLLNPAITIFMAVSVGVIIIATMQPMLQQMSFF